MRESGPASGQIESPGEPNPQPSGRSLALLSVAALGVVYGDIGTSPIYAFRESFHGSYGLAADDANVLGVLSLIFWALILVITVKYLIFVLRADNRGEGGIMALTALVDPRGGTRGPRQRLLMLIGLFGAALLYGDGMITPAISVLSAVEGLEVATPFFTPYVIPITVVILIGLFLVQHKGTAGIGGVFGPLMLAWFLCLAVLGIHQLVHEPSVLAALNPLLGARFFSRNGLGGFLVLGSVFLVVTGGEALYADMGHFGRRPIRLTWFWIVLPALVLNYFGQGAMILRDASTIEQPFFSMAPEWALYPLVILTTAATVIASQAVISGAFSLTRQGIMLGYLPRLKVTHTSLSKIGQIYVPMLNWALMIACIGLVLGFRSSSNLAAAYGVAVTTDMVFTTILFAVVTRTRWGWPAATTVLLAASFLVVDLSFWGANMVKVPHGGWFPLVVAAGAFIVMTTWRTGRHILNQRLVAGKASIRQFVATIVARPPARVSGTAIYLNRLFESTPAALSNNLEFNKVLHERVVLLTVAIHEVPRVDPEDRVSVERLGHGFFRVKLGYGFAEEPDVPSALASLEEVGLEYDPRDTTFVLSRERLFATERPGMAIWREKLFAWLSRNSSGATSFFHLPHDRVVEMGSQVEL